MFTTNASLATQIGAALLAVFATAASFMFAA
jgi:hypothetical protein